MCSFCSKIGLHIAPPTNILLITNKLQTIDKIYSSTYQDNSRNSTTNPTEYIQHQSRFTQIR
jgi:hypothetical protein